MQEKIKAVFSAVEVVVELLYAPPHTELPAWVDQEWLSGLKQEFTKYLLTISVRDSQHSHPLLGGYERVL